MNPTPPPAPAPAPADDAVIVVPLSCLPESAGIVPTSSNGSDTNPSAGAKSCSSASSTSSTSSVASTKPGRSRASMLALAVNHPQQVPGDPTNSRRTKLLALAGRVGWCGKAVVYALIGGLACDSAAANRSPAPVSTTCQVSASPQGAFVLIGTVPGGGLNVVMLIVALVALVCYITWRFWEGLAGQGYNKSFSAKKNFFKFRVSPLVSGCVYVSYLVFILQLLDTQVRQVGCSPGGESWPSTWRYSTGGKVGLALLGLAFLIATCIQLQGVLSRQWHRDYRDDLPQPFMRTVFVAGHIGFAGRAAAFLAMAVLFLKDASGAGDEASHNSSMVSNALLQLQQTAGLRALLMIVGVLLVCYGLFATLSSVAREFPTLPPTRHKALPADEVLARPPDEELGHTTAAAAAAAASDEEAAADGAAPVAAAAGHRSSKASKPSVAAVRFVEAAPDGEDDMRAARDGGFVTIELQ